MSIRRVAAQIAEVVGVALVVAGAWVASVWAGLAVTGAVLVAGAWIADRGR